MRGKWRRSADLAGLGWTAAPQILDAPRGFFHAYGGSFDITAIQGNWAIRGAFPNRNFFEALSIGLTDTSGDDGYAAVNSEIRHHSW